MQLTFKNTLKLVLERIPLLLGNVVGNQAGFEWNYILDLNELPVYSRRQPHNDKAILWNKHTDNRCMHGIMVAQRKVQWTSRRESKDVHIENNIQDGSQRIISLEKIRGRERKNKKNIYNGRGQRRSWMFGLMQIFWYCCTSVMGKSVKWWN